MGDATPERILVVDDVISEGSTWILTLGLLRLIFRQAVVHFLAAGDSFQDGLWKAWAQDSHPELLERVKRENEDESIQYNDRLEHRIAELANGTEDIDPESLAWKPITAESELLKQLGNSLSADEWLSLPKFVEETISREIAERATNYKPNGQRTSEKWPALKPEWLILCEIWLYGSRTQKQLMEALGWQDGKMRYWFTRLIERGAVAIQKQRRANLYALSPHACGENEDEEEPLLDTYWVVPGKLMAGAFPGWPGKYDDLQPRLDRLFDLGVTSFIDLSTWYEGNPIETYGTALKDKAAKRGADVEYHAFTPKPRQLPKPALVKQILDCIDQSLVRGQIVYVHCNSGIEVTGIIVGCYLVRHGMTGKDALREIERMRAGTFYAWKRSPITERGRRMVRKWTDDRDVPI